MGFQEIMDSSVSMRGRSGVVPKEELDNHLNLKPSPVLLKSHPSGNTPSFSSSSSSSSSFSSVLPPSTPLHFSGVPFSWEKTPGIPKKLSPSQKKDKDKHEDEDEDEGSADLQGRILLPLPPLMTPPSSRRFFGHDDISLGKKVLFPGDAGAWYQWDPFVAALVECSKEEEGYHYCNGGKSIVDREKGSRLWNGRRVSRSIIDRFSFLALYACSCKRASPTPESIIYLPRSSTSSFIVTNGRSR